MDPAMLPALAAVPSAMELALLSLVVALSERDPGLIDRWLDLAENDALHTEVRRLHEAAPNPELTKAVKEQVALVRRGRFIVAAHVCRGKKRR